MEELTQQAMTNHDVTLVEPQVKHRQLRCPKCAACSRLTHSILDSRRGKTVRLYRCAGCGECLWDDGSTLFGEGFNGLGRFGE